MRIVLFPGTFDPITTGHIDIIDRALPLFDKLVVGIGMNANKKPMFSEDDRLKWIRECYKMIQGYRRFVMKGLPWIAVKLLEQNSY